MVDRRNTGWNDSRYKQQLDPVPEGLYRECMTEPRQIAEELHQDYETALQLDLAGDALEALSGELVDAIKVTSRKADEAPFYARIVSKLSPMVGNLMEQRIVTLLSESAGDGYTWLRQDPGFPDAVLVRERDHEILAGYEIKAWYVLSTEITGRFRESVNLLVGKNINVVIVAWCMSHLVFGQPQILGVLVVSGEELALSRDSHYHKPPEYLTIEPNDTSDRTANLQQSNVNGYKLQESKSDPTLVAAARQRPYTEAPAHSAIAQAEAAQLMVDLEYRLDTNFAKIDRVANANVEDFKTEILSSSYLDRTITQWKLIFAELNSKVDSKRERAERVIETLFDQMAATQPKTAVSEESPYAH